MNANDVIYYPGISNLYIIILNGKYIILRIPSLNKYAK